MEKLTITQFRAKFPDDNACLDHLFKLRFSNLSNCPECNRLFSFKRVKGRRSYQCDGCRHQIYPTANTVFEKTTTPLNYWFYAIYLFTVTRNGVAAKELERQLSICYKTALRMAHQIKKLMFEDITEKMVGEVIADEYFYGGASRNMHKHKRLLRKNKTGYVHKKAAIFAVISKNGEKIVTKVLDADNVNGAVLKPILNQYVDRGSVLVTDTFGGYSGLNKVFAKHVTVSHQIEEYSKGSYSTNRVENYWAHLARMIKGTHISVSRKHLDKYVAEHSFRYTNRHQPEKMFDLILSRV